LAQAISVQLSQVIHAWQIYTMRRPVFSSNALGAKDLNQLENQFQDLLRPVATRFARLCVEKVEQERASGANYSHSRSLGQLNASTAQSALDSGAWTRGWFDAKKVPDMPSTSSPATDPEPKTVRRSVLVRHIEAQDPNSKDYYNHIYRNSCALALWLSQSHDEDAEDFVVQTSTSKRPCNVRQVANLVACVRRNLADPEAAANKPKPKVRTSRRRSSANGSDQQQQQQQFPTISERSSVDSNFPTVSRASEPQVEPISERDRGPQSPKFNGYGEAMPPHEQRVSLARRSTALNEELSRALLDITSDLQRANALSRTSVCSSANETTAGSFSGSVPAPYTRCISGWGSTSDLGEVDLSHKTSVELSPDRHTILAVESTLSAVDEIEPSKSMIECAGPNWHGLVSDKANGSQQSSK